MLINTKRIMTFRLSERFRYLLGGKEVTHTIRWWINNHPLIIFNHVYKSHALGLKRMGLNTDAQNFLAKELARTHPELRKLIYDRGLARKKRKKFYQKSRTEYR